MSFITEQRDSDSPYIASIMRGWTANDGTSIRPAESHWHMVLLRYQGFTRLILVGPWTRSGLITYDADAELLWIKFKLGTFMPHLSTQEFRDAETVLPGAASRSFLLQGSAWQFPDFENVETFVERLVRQEVLVCDPVVQAGLRDRPLELSPRTLRHRFLRSTGLTQGLIRQIERAQQAETLLRQGTSILDTVFEAGYYDQPHLTRALKQFIGYTPAQLLALRDLP